MDHPVYVRRLIEQKYIVIVGAIVSLVAGFLAGFEIVDGEVQSLAAKTYSASSTIMISEPEPEYLRVEVPAETELVTFDEEGNWDVDEMLVTITDARRMALYDTAMVYAYLAASDEVANAVAEDIGGLEYGESISAVRRTTQPGDDERFEGRFNVPFLDISATAESPERAELVAASATRAFTAMIVERQEELGVAPNIRTILDVLNAPVAEEEEGSNPAIPSVVTGFAIFLLFIALALTVGMIRERRAARPKRERPKRERSKRERGRRKSAKTGTSAAGASGADTADAAAAGGGEKSANWASSTTGRTPRKRVGRRKDAGVATENANEPPVPDK